MVLFIRRERHPEKGVVGGNKGEYRQVAGTGAGLGCLGARG